MRVVATIGWGPVSREGAIAVPSLQGKDRYSNQFTKVFQRICMLHATILYDSLRKNNTAESSFQLALAYRSPKFYRGYVADRDVNAAKNILSKARAWPSGANVHQ